MATIGVKGILLRKEKEFGMEVVRFGKLRRKIRIEVDILRLGKLGRSMLRPYKDISVCW